MPFDPCSRADVVRRRSSRAFFGALACVLLSAPAGSQVELPTVRHTAPEVAAPGDITTVRVECSLPPGFRSVREPRVRVTDREGRDVEFLPILIINIPTLGGYRGLTTGSYAPGAYQVRAELEYFAPGGPIRLATSDWTLLTVAPPTSAVRPIIRHSTPATASRSQRTPVQVEFELPSGHELVRNPRVVAVDSMGRLVNLLPITLTQRPPIGKGQRELQTNVYAPGGYRVRAEMDYLDPGGQSATVVSSWSDLVVE
jgi:hypothetical protein